MLIDTTLREGAQAYGVYFGGGAKRRMAELLSAAGVDELECGWVGQPGLEEFLAWAADALPGAERGGPRLSVWCPCREADARQAAELAGLGLVERVNIGAPSSARHREKRLGLSLPEMKARLSAVVALARAEGVDYVSVGLEDISRADADEALELAQAAVAAGAARVRLSDTVGLLTPLTTAGLVHRFAEALPVPVALHAHNDLGMATANAITALQCGAAFVDVSALGLGERAGIAAVEQVAAWAGQRAGGARYDLTVLRALCLLAGQAAKVPVARNRPVVGEDIFAAESGIHVHGLLRDPALFEPFAPETVGASRRVGVGAKSGGAALGAALTRLCGAAACDSGLVGRVRSLAERLGRPLTDKELLGVL